MTSLAVSGIAPFLDYAGLLMFVEKISMYLIAGATFYFLRTTKKDTIDTKDNSEFNADPSARNTMFNEITSRIELTEGSIVTLQNEVIQLRNNLPDKQDGNQQNDGNQSEASDSSQRSFSDMTSEIWNQFEIIFDRIMAERRCSFDDMCNVVMVDLLNLGWENLVKI